VFYFNVEPRLWRGGFAAAADAHCETQVSRNHAHLSGHTTA